LFEGLGNGAPALLLMAALFVVTLLAFSPRVRRMFGPRSAPPPQRSPDGLPAPQAFNILEPGKRYRVTQAWEDFDRQRHEIGETWTFRTYAFLPYEDGLSWFVSPEEGTNRHIRIQWRPENGQQYEVASNPSAFLEEVS
jgi:hypothetical protein